MKQCKGVTLKALWQLSWDPLIGSAQRSKETERSAQVEEHLGATDPLIGSAQRNEEARRSAEVEEHVCSGAFTSHRSGTNCYEASTFLKYRNDPQRSRIVNRHNVATNILQLGYAKARATSRQCDLCC